MEPQIETKSTRLRVLAECYTTPVLLPAVKLTRRSFFPFLGISWSLGSSRLSAQGMASRGVKPRPHSKPSGIPFLARFTDIAAAAGLRAPIIYGGIDRKDYIVETMGCGCAFLDYDGDGWLDIFVLCGTRFGPP